MDREFIVVIVMMIGFIFFSIGKYIKKNIEIEVIGRIIMVLSFIILILLKLYY